MEKKSGSVEEKDSGAEWLRLGGVFYLYVLFICGLVAKSMCVPPKVDGSVDIGGLEFPLEASRGLTLVGGGIRKKFGTVKVYAAGIYLDKKGTDKVVSALEPEDAALDQAFYDDIVSSTSYAKSVVLKFHKDVEAALVESSLADALSKSLSEESLDKFSTALEEVVPAGTDIPIGTKISIQCKGETATFTNGEASSSLTDETVCPALFGVYLGKSPVSKDIKEGFGNGALSKARA